MTQQVKHDLLCFDVLPVYALSFFNTMLQANQQPHSDYQ